jgi:uncharacterized OB-fold protein
MAISIKAATVQKNTDGTYQVNVLHTDGKTSVVSFTHVPFAAELAAGYADFINGVVKVETVLSPVASTIDADAKKALADAKVEADKLLADAKVEADKIIADAKAVAEKLIADAKAEIAKLTATTSSTTEVEDDK